MRLRLKAAWIVSVLTTIAIIALSDARCPAQDGQVQPVSVLRSQVLTEYPPALARLEARYSRIRGAAQRLVHSTDSKGNVRTTASRITIVRDGNNYLGTEKTDVEAGEEERVRSTNSRYSFLLRFDPPTQTYVIDNVEGDGNEVAPRFGSYCFDGSFPAAYYAFGRPISELMALPSYKLKSVSEVQEEGRRLIKIAFDFRPANDYPIIPAWILVDPAEGWILRRYEGLFGPRQNLPRRGEVAYTRTSGGELLAKTVKHTKNLEDDTFEIVDLTFGESVPERDFTLTAFGLPEVNEPAASRGGITWNYLFLGIGLVLAVVSIGLKILARRLSRS